MSLPGTEATDNIDAMVKPVMTWLSRNPDHNDMMVKGNAFIGQFPADKGLKVASALSFANPFFLPNISERMAADLKIDTGQFSIFAMRAKMTVRRANQPNLMVACAPKSASTFIHAALVRALNLPNACLFTAAYDWTSAALLGANLREQEPDELSLIRNGLNGRGYVAQHHSRCSPYLARLLDFYHVRPIVTHRNIADTVVSMDDMLMDWRSRPQSSQYGYFSDGMPANFEHLDREDRLMILAQRWTAWLVQFYLTWRKCEAGGTIKPLWISYEKDFLGDKTLLAERLADFIGRDIADAGRIAAALEDKSDGKVKRLNKGVAGRGRDLPEKVRAEIVSIASYCRDEDDLSPLVEF
jgi:hypothetical protein